MTSALSGSTGMYVTDLLSNPSFAEQAAHPRYTVREVEAMQRIGETFAATPPQVLRELVSVSLNLCGAESTGISLEEPAPGGGTQFRWIATAGAFAPFLNSVLPRDLTPCGICLDRNNPQLVRIEKRFFDAIGIDAPPAADGIIVPWQVDDLRGTLWAVNHSEDRPFNLNDYRALQALADFAATAVRNQLQRDALTRHAADTAAAAMANHLAHRINNPLQSLMNTVFLAGRGGEDAGRFARQANEDLLKLSALVKELLRLPTSY